jgi:hypothetical protein
MIPRGVVQLFVDDYLIASQHDLSRTLHQPVKDNGGAYPVIAVPAEGTLLAKGTVLQDPRLDRYVMFAKGFQSKRMHRFTSMDGLNWDPQGEVTESRTINLDAVDPATGRAEGYGGMHSFFYDHRDRDHPYKGWVFFGNWGNEHEGVYYIRSADGITWERGPMVVNGYAGPGDPSCRVIHQDGKTVYGPGDTTRFSYDPIGDRLLGIFKFFTTERVDPENNIRSRAYAFLDALDAPFDASRIEHVDLMPAVAERNGDRPSDEYYASTAWRYEDLWLGGLLVWHRTGDYPWSAAGCAFLKLVVSRDGLHWKKVPFKNEDGVPEVFIPNGTEGGNGGRNDGGYMSEFSQGPLRIGDELIYYYGCSSYGKNHSPERRNSGGGIFRARLRMDGFVSVDRGTITTPLLQFAGERLRVNGIGPIRVQVLDARGDQLAVSEITGDSLEHAVTFAGRSLDETASGRMARLRWTVEPGGRLYSFTVD